jgi:2-keto-4-pentenoate hydratase
MSMKPTTHDATGITEAVDRITSALTTSQPVAPIRGLIGETDIDAAYAVQQELVARRIAAGGVVVGRKIGLTSPAVQQQLGVDQPDFGVLFADMDVSSEPLVPSGRLLQPKAEAEIAFVLSDDLSGADFSTETVSAAVGYAVVFGRPVVLGLGRSVEVELGGIGILSILFWMGCERQTVFN